MTKQDWIKTADRLPEEGERVEWKFHRKTEFMSFDRMTGMFIHRYFQCGTYKLGMLTVESWRPSAEEENDDVATA